VHDLGRVDSPPGLRRWRMRRRLARAIARVGTFDVLHSYMGVPGIVAAPIARRLHVPLIITLDSGELVGIDDIEDGLQRRWFDRRALARAMRAAAGVTVSTEFMASQPALDGRSVSIVPMGVDPTTFPEAARADGPPWRLLRVASLNPVKDYPTLLQ